MLAQGHPMGGIQGHECYWATRKKQIVQYLYQLALASLSVSRASPISCSCASCADLLTSLLVVMSQIRETLFLRPACNTGAERATTTSRNTHQHKPPVDILDHAPAQLAGELLVGSLSLQGDDDFGVPPLCGARLREGTECFKHIKSRAYM